MSVMPPGSRSSSPRWARRLQRRGARGDRRRAARRTRSATAVAASTFARLPGPRSGVSTRTSPCGVRDVGGHAVEAAVLHVDARGRRPASSMPKVTTPAGERAGARAITRGSSALATSRSSGPRLLEDLRLGVGDRVGRREEPQVRVADVRPDAHVRLGDADQRADFPGVIHAELDHRHVRPATAARAARAAGRCDCSGSPCSETPRYRADRNSAVSFLRRRLARAAGDRHDPRARSPPHVARDVLQRPGRVRHLDEHGRRPAVACLGAAAGVASTSAPPRPRASAAATNCVPVEPIAANRDEQIARRQRPRVDREPLDRRSRRRRATSRPPVAAAISPAVSAQRAPRATTPCEPARRRASAARATSTSSNGSVRSPITWYFSCPLPAMSTRSPGRASRTAARSPRVRSTIASDGVGLRPRARRRAIRSAGMTMPRLISSMICSGSSRARVVGRDDHEIAQPRRDGAHQRPLRAIAIAAAAEDGDRAGRSRAAAPSRAGSSARRRCARSRR